MRRTRRLILLIIALILAGVTATWRVQKGLQEQRAPAKPARLPESVSARAEQWTWEEMRGDKPGVRVSARAYKQNTATGNIELEDVELHLFHPDGVAYDRVRSAKADFSLSDGVLYSDGDVEITRGLSANPQIKPASHLITIKTSGTRFDSKSGRATTDRPAEFLFEHGEGKCVGATYDPANKELQMHNDVKLLWRGADPKKKPMEVEAGSLVYKEAESKVLLMPWSKFRRDTLSMGAGAAVVSIENGAIQLVEAQNAKGIDTRPRQQTEYSADSLNIRFDPNGVLQSVTGETNARLLTTTATGRTTVNSRRIDLDFQVQGEDSVLQKGLATGAAVIESAPIPRPNVPMADTRFMRSEIINLFMRPGGEEIERVETGAPGSVEFRPNRPGQKRRTIDGEHLKILYGAANEVESFQAIAVKTRTDAEREKGKPQPPPAFTTSKGMNATFDPKTGTVKLIEQWGDFRYEEGERKATSERAELHGGSEDVVLQGGARVWDTSGSTSADTILMHQKSGETEASGRVSSTRLPEKKKDKTATPGMLSGDEPLQAKADKMTSSDKNQVIVYEGNALLWQGANRVQADRIRIDRKAGRLDAWGKVDSQFLEKADAAKKTKKGFTVVRAPELNYDDKQRLAHYKGGAKLDRGAMVVTAREIRAFLKQGEGESSLDHAFADGGVKIVEMSPERSRTGSAEHAEYWAGDGKVVLTGGQPQVIDSKSGNTRGRQITYYSNTERLVVEGEQARPAESRIPRKSD